MSEFKVGDKVFDLRYGNGVVSSVSDTVTFPVLVRFRFANVSFMKNGSLDSLAIPTLYHGHDLIVEVKEPEYEWQVLSKNTNGEYSMSTKFYKNINDHDPYMSSIHLNHELFEPSKRLVKKG